MHCRDVGIGENYVGAVMVITLSLKMKECLGFLSFKNVRFQKSILLRGCIKVVGLGGSACKKIG